MRLKAAAKKVATAHYWVNSTKGKAQSKSDTQHDMGIAEVEDPPDDVCRYSNALVGNVQLGSDSAEERILELQNMLAEEKQRREEAERKIDQLTKLLSAEKQSDGQSAKH